MPSNPYKLKENQGASITQQRTNMCHMLRAFTISCRMCSLGKEMLEEKGKIFDPHVFSNMQTDARYMVVGQNPGFDECQSGLPFIGKAGENFDNTLVKNGLKREDFYITNVTKCHTLANKAPDHQYRKICSHILRLEIMAMRPRIIVTLGAQAFDFFCPDKKMSKHLGDIVMTDLGPIFPIYHPSPRNWNLEERRSKIEANIKLLSKLIKKLNKE